MEKYYFTLSTIVQDPLLFQTKIQIQQFRQYSRYGSQVMVRLKNSPQTTEESLQKILYNYATVSNNCQNNSCHILWSNGLVERHNIILSDMLDKILHESSCHFDFALARAIIAKNSLSIIQIFILLIINWHQPKFTIFTCI